MNYLITYDIARDKKRKKLSDLLETYGVRVNYSVFECELNQTKLKKLIKQINDEDLVDKKLDSIRFYRICENCVPKCFELSDRGDVFQKQDLYFD